MGFFGKSWEDLRPQIKFELGKWILGKALESTVIAGALSIASFLFSGGVGIGGFAIIALVCLVVLIVLGWLPNRSTQTIQQTGKQQALATDGPKVAEVDAAYNKLEPTMRADVENPIRTQIAKIPNAADRETFLVRILTVGWVFVTFNEIWMTPIFGSQILALQKLNSGSVKRADLFPFYADTAKANPAVYANYSYDQWIAFMREKQLLREDGDMVSITIRGREFLKYLIDNGKSARDRTL